MGTKASPVEIINIADDNGDDDISILYSSPNVQSLRNNKKKGTSKGNAISVENYCHSMEDRDFHLAIMPSITTSSSGRRRNFIDLSADFEYSDDFQFLTLNSIHTRDRKPFSQKGGISIFEPGQSSNSSNPKNDDDDDDSVSPVFMCEICADLKPFSESFPIKGCTHSYCSDCTHMYVASKIQENITRIPCPGSGCAGILEPEYCRSILPPEVFDRWGDALCEAMILASHKFYCPFKDCSALLIQDDDCNDSIMESECPVCRRLFCARCKVPWHSGIACGEFQNLHKDEREREDIMLMQLAKNNKWTRCPQCKFYVEKSEGCLFMKCRFVSLFLLMITYLFVLLYFNLPSLRSKIIE